MATIKHNRKQCAIIYDAPYRKAQLEEELRLLRERPETTGEIERSTTDYLANAPTFPAADDSLLSAMTSNSDFLPNLIVKYRWGGTSKSGVFLVVNFPDNVHEVAGKNGVRNKHGILEVYPCSVGLGNTQSDALDECRAAREALSFNNVATRMELDPTMPGPRLYMHPQKNVFVFLLPVDRKMMNLKNA